MDCYNNCFLLILLISTFAHSMDQQSQEMRQQQEQQRLEYLRNTALRIVMAEGYLDPENLGSRLSQNIAQLCMPNNNISRKRLDVAKHFDRQHPLVFNPNGQLCAVSNENDISVHDTRTGDQVNLLRGHTQPVRCLGFSSDGRHLFSTSYGFEPDKTLCVWEVASGTLVKRCTFDRPMHYFQCFSPDCQSVALRGDFGKGHEAIWNFNQDSLIQCDRGDFCSSSFSSDGRLLCFGETGWSGGNLVIWDIALQRAIKVLKGFSVSSIVFSHTGRLMAGTAEGIVYIWDTKNWKLKNTLKLDEHQYLNLAFSHDDQLVAVGGAEGINIYDVQSGCLMQVIPVEGKRSLGCSNFTGKTIHDYGNINTVAFNCNGQLGAVTYDGAVFLWNRIPDNVRLAFRSLNLNQLLILMSLARQAAAGRMIQLNPNGDACALINQMPFEIKSLLAPYLNQESSGGVWNALINVMQWALWKS